MTKKLREGFSTGSCMTGGAAASAVWQTTGRCPSVIRVDTPIGKTLYLDVVPKEYGTCAIVKYGGDDPDVTHGCEIVTRLEILDYDLKTVKNGGIPDIVLRAKNYGEEKLAGEIGVGLPTLRDMLEELKKPGRDPRDELPKPVLRTDVLDMKDLTPGMELTGTVRNVIDFGAFVDIGVHQDGLVHISRMADRFIRHPSEAVKVGDVVKVWVVSVDEKKKRIALTMVKDRM